MKRYQIVVDEVHRTTYEVSAKDEEDALRFVQEGGEGPSTPVIAAQEGQGALDGAIWNVAELDNQGEEVKAWEYSEAYGWEEEEGG
jgi:hypothetical protein